MMDESVYLHKIQRIIDETVDDKTMPETAPAIATLMTKYRPVNANEPHNSLTSEDVQLLLDPICTPTLNDIAVVMIYLGYKLAFGPQDFAIHWAVVPAWETPEEFEINPN